VTPDSLAKELFQLVRETSRLRKNGDRQPFSPTATDNNQQDPAAKKESVPIFPQPANLANDPSPERWEQLIALADRTHMTLLLHGTRLPQHAEQKVEERWAKNSIRRRRLQESFLEIAHELDSRGISYVLLKGFTHESGFGLKSGSRVQSDLDFLVSPADLGKASAALQELGYSPHGTSDLSAEHHRPWVRPFTWTWRGDYFDPEMPIPVELHDSVWSASGDRIECPGLEEFWNRKSTLTICGMTVQAFAEIDLIAFAALHALRHILRNDARPAHVF
jgi:hypothetical protein